MAKNRSLIQRLPLAPVFGAMFGAAAGILVAAIPTWLFEATVASSGIGEVLSMAQPPLGIKARLLAIALAFAGGALIGWLAGRGVDQLLLRPRAPRVVEENDALDLGAFVAEAEPLAVPRRPIFAERELGAPLMSDEALATGAAIAEPFPAFDPKLFDDAPAEDPLFADVATDPVLHAPLAIEEFDLPPAPEEPETLPGETSIEALIRRLEAGMARRAAPPPPEPGIPTTAPAAAADNREWMVRDADSASFDEDTPRAFAGLHRQAG